MTQFGVNKGKLEGFFFSSHEKKSRERFFSTIHVVKLFVKPGGTGASAVTGLSAVLSVPGPALCGNVFFRARVLASQKPAVRSHWHRMA